MNKLQTRMVLAAVSLAAGLVLTPSGALAAAPARGADVTPPSTPGRLIPLPTPFGFGWAPSTDDRERHRRRL